jgi:hypothetical protein
MNVCGRYRVLWLVLCMLLGSLGFEEQKIIILPKWWDNVSGGVGVVVVARLK